MGDNEELSVDQETVDQKVDQPGIGDEPQPQNSTDDFDPKCCQVNITLLRNQKLAK